MKGIKNNIPVYDICTLKNGGHPTGDIVALPFTDYLIAHPNLHFPHRHSFYHIFLFTKGGGYHTIDFQHFQVKPGQIYFMCPGQVHDWRFDEGTDGYVVNFPESLFDGFLANSHYLDMFPFLQGSVSESVVELNADIFAAARKVIRELIVTANERKPHTPDLIRTYLIQLFIIVHRNISGNTPLSGRSQSQLVLHNFRKLVDTHYAEIRLPKSYASMLYITPNHLNALCKDLIGKSAGVIIRDRILLESKRLLVNADLSIATIAMQLNFTDNAHFTRFFKKHTQTTPEEFRRQTSRRL